MNLSCISKNILMVLLLAAPVCSFSATSNPKGAKDESVMSYKVSELYSQKVHLDNKRVRAKGKVVKVTFGIMNKNWIHLQDGSGDRSKKNNDLTVTTTQDLPSVGDVVVVEGVMRKDKNFGGGYFYEVIIEEATVNSK